MKPPPRLMTATEEHAHQHGHAGLAPAAWLRPSPLDAWLHMALRHAYNERPCEPMVPELAHMVERLRLGEPA